MKRRVTRVAAFVDQCLGRFLGHADLHEPLVRGVAFTKMGAQPALSVVNVLHGRFSGRLVVPPFTGKRDTVRWTNSPRDQRCCGVGRRGFAAGIASHFI
jgi:hypothetical protein